MQAAASKMFGALLLSHPEAKAAENVERSLITAALDGDGRAFADLVRPHLGLLYRLARRTCHDVDLAEDAVQETLDIAYRGLGRYRPGTSLRAYLAAIAVRRAHTLARAERRRKVREDAALAPASVPSPAELVGVADTQRRIREALSCLPEKRRAAAMFRLDGGLSHAEIAVALGTSESSARVLVHLALKELRAQLSDLLREEQPDSSQGRRGDP